MSKVIFVFVSALSTAWAGTVCANAAVNATTPSAIVATVGSAPIEIEGPAALNIFNALIANGARSLITTKETTVAISKVSVVRYPGCNLGHYEAAFQDVIAQAPVSESEEGNDGGTLPSLFAALAALSSSPADAEDGDPIRYDQITCRRPGGTLSATCTIELRAALED